MLHAQYEYGPFAEPIRATGPMAAANPFRFSTKYQDAETDMLYYGYRYSSPSLGRSLSRDPIGELSGPNLVLFDQNNLGEVIDGLGLICAPACSCKEVTLTTQGNVVVSLEQKRQKEPKEVLLRVGPKIDIAIRLEGDRASCKCRAKDKGIMKATVDGQKHERPFRDEENSIPCDLPHDIPGPEIDPIPWGRTLNVEVGMDLTVTITCIGTDGSHAQASITVKIDPPRKLIIKLPLKPDDR